MSESMSETPEKVLKDALQISYVRARTEAEDLCDELGKDLGVCITPQESDSGPKAALGVVEIIVAALLTELTKIAIHRFIDWVELYWRSKKGQGKKADLKIFLKKDKDDVGMVYCVRIVPGGKDNLDEVMKDIREFLAEAYP